MAPDDPGSVRELRFRHGAHHIIVTASPDGSGQVRVLGDVQHMEVPALAKKAALKATVKMLSIARRWVFEEFLKVGGTVEELRDEDDRAA